MFDFSFAELALIAVVAVVFIGPKELPAVVQTIAKGLRAVRSLTSEVRSAFDELSRETGLKDAADHVNREITMIKGDDGTMYEAYPLPKQDSPPAAPPSGQS